MKHDCLVLATNIENDNRNLGTSFPAQPYDYADQDLEYMKALRKPTDIPTLEIFLRAWGMNRVLGHKDCSSWREKLKPVLTHYRSFLENLRKFDLLTVDLRQHKDDIVSMFEGISGVVRYTAAAKVIHVQSPELFVPWDSRIRGANGCAENGQGFYNFLCRMREELSEAMVTYAAASSAESDPLRGFMARIASPSPPISITRIMDHYNYLKHTEKDPARKLPPC